MISTRKKMLTDNHRVLKYENIRKYANTACFCHAKPCAHSLCTLSESRTRRNDCIRAARTVHHEVNTKPKVGDNNIIDALQRALFYLQRSTTTTTTTTTK
jgi:hypothetical protein